MDVFLLTIYLCTVIASDDLKGRVCDWHSAGYYDNIKDCAEAARANKPEHPDPDDHPMCQPVVVL